MKKKIDRNSIILILSILCLALFISVLSHFFKYSETEWLKHFNDISALEKISSFSFWWYICTYSFFGIAMYLYPLVLIICACYAFHNVFQSGFLQNIVIRSNYKKTIFYEIIKSWRYALVLPTILLIFFIVSSILFPNFEILSYNQTDGFPFQLVNNFMEEMNPFLFMIIYFIILIFLGIVIINIGICMILYFKKFYLLTIGSFLILIFIENINNFFLAPLISSITGIEKMLNGFSIYNLYYLDASPSIFWSLGYVLILFTISLIFVYLLYRKKENVVLNNV